MPQHLILPHQHLGLGLVKELSSRPREQTGPRSPLIEVARRRGEAPLLGVLDRRCRSARAMSNELRGKTGDRGRNRCGRGTQIQGWSLDTGHCLDGQWSDLSTTASSPDCPDLLSLDLDLGVRRILRRRRLTWNLLVLELLMELSQAGRAAVARIVRGHQPRGAEDGLRLLVL